MKTTSIALAVLFVLLLVVSGCSNGTVQNTVPQNNPQQADAAIDTELAQVANENPDELNQLEQDLLNEPY